MNPLLSLSHASFNFWLYKFGLSRFSLTSNHSQGVPRCSKVFQGVPTSLEVLRILYDQNHSISMKFSSSQHSFFSSFTTSSADSGADSSGPGSAGCVACVPCVACVASSSSMTKCMWIAHLKLQKGEFVKFLTLLLGPMVQSCFKMWAYLQSVVHKCWVVHGWSLLDLLVKGDVTFRPRKWPKQYWKFFTLRAAFLLSVCNSWNSPVAQIAAGTKRYQNIFDFKQGMHAMAKHSIKWVQGEQCSWPFSIHPLDTSHFFQRDMSPPHSLKIFSTRNFEANGSPWIITNPPWLKIGPCHPHNFTSKALLSSDLAFGNSEGQEASESYAFCKRYCAHVYLDTNGKSSTNQPISSNFHSIPFSRCKVKLVHSDKRERRWVLLPCQRSRSDKACSFSRRNHAAPCNLASPEPASGRTTLQVG